MCSKTHAISKSLEIQKEEQSTINVVKAEPKKLEPLAIGKFSKKKLKPISRPKKLELGEKGPNSQNKGGD